jgi:DNA-directed RNA polymerase specialized sigma24 family protein
MTESALVIQVESPGETLDEERALIAVARNDPEAAGKLFNKYYAQVFGYIYRSTLERPVAEDLTANVFLSAFRRLGLFRWRRVPFGAWLYRIATNEIRMHYRRQKRMASASSEARFHGSGRRKTPHTPLSRVRP